MFLTVTYHPHVGDVALLAFRQYFDASPTNLIEGQQHHVERAGEERTAFLALLSEFSDSWLAACTEGGPWYHGYDTVLSFSFLLRQKKTRFFAHVAQLAFL